MRVRFSQSCDRLHLTLYCDTGTIVYGDANMVANNDSDMLMKNSEPYVE